MRTQNITEPKNEFDFFNQIYLQSGTGDPQDPPPPDDSGDPTPEDPNIPPEPEPPGRY